MGHHSSTHAFTFNRGWPWHSNVAERLHFSVQPRAPPASSRQKASKTAAQSGRHGRSHGDHARAETGHCGRLEPGRMHAQRARAALATALDRRVKAPLRRDGTASALAR